MGALGLLLGLLAAAYGSTGSGRTGRSDTGWILVWSDEFNLPDGSAPDPTKWAADTGGYGFGNQELEYYTPGTANSAIQGGMLVLTAQTNSNPAYSCTYAPTSPGTCLYTSGRWRTTDPVSHAVLAAFGPYGKIEGRIKVPTGKGMWPAFWLVGANVFSVGSPQAGEIDIFEIRGDQPANAYGGLHFLDSRLTTPTDNSMAVAYTLPSGALSDAFHVYGIEWGPSYINYYVDSTIYWTITPATANGRTWLADHSFFLLINLAVGGTYGGNPDGTTVFPAQMYFDWIRVYQKSRS